jgi:hypothetical protein
MILNIAFKKYLPVHPSMLSTTGITSSILTCIRAYPYYSILQLQAVDSEVGIQKMLQILTGLV